MSKSRGVLLYYAGYHEWATSRVLSAITSQLTAEQIEADSGLFFRSIRGTLNHLYLAEALWYHRLCQGTADIPSPLHGTEKYWGKAAEEWEAYSQAHNATILLAKQSKLWRPLVHSLTEKPDDDARTCSYLDTKGNLTKGRPVVPCLMHIFNHATHHRGQIHAAMTRFGIQEPFVLDMPAMPDHLFKI